MVKPKVTMKERLQQWKSKHKRQATSREDKQLSSSTLASKQNNDDDKGKSGSLSPLVFPVQENDHPNVLNSAGLVASPLACSILSELSGGRASPISAPSSSSRPRCITSDSHPALGSVASPIAATSPSPSKRNRALSDSSRIPISDRRTSSSSVVSKDAEVCQLHEEIKQLKQANETAAAAQKAAEERSAAAEASAERCWAEVAAQHFINGVQAQAVEQLEREISQNRMTSNENTRDKTRKHKLELRRLRQERDELEARCENFMEQMEDIQEACMKRIDSLEEDLLEEKHQRDLLAGELTAARSLALRKSADLAVALKQLDQLGSKFSLEGAQLGLNFNDDSDTDEADED